MPAMSVGGLASGLDTNSIISQLTALEQTKVTREAKKKEAAQSTLDKFKELQTRLSTLQSKANGLNVPANFNVFAATSNYPEYAQVKGGEGATAGQYEIKINQLATTQKVASKSFAAINTPLEGNTGGTITLSTSIAAQKKDSTEKGKTVDVKIEASDTLKDIVNKINAAEGTGVRASLMTMANGDNRLVLTAVDTGTNAFFLKEEGGTSILSSVLGILSENEHEQKAKSANALVTLDGKAATEATTFDKLNTVLNKNNLAGGDVVGIYLPTDKGDGSSGWVTFDLYKRNFDIDPSLPTSDPDYGKLALGSDGKPIAKTIGDVLGEINTALSASGANFTAKLNSSGEIVLEGDLDSDGNFGFDPDGKKMLGLAKIQIIGLKDYQGETKEDIADLFNNVLTQAEKDALVKKDMGKFSSANVFQEVVTDAQNAFYTLNGMGVSSQSNEDDKIINGTTFVLMKVTTKLDEPVKVALELDQNALVDKIAGFIEEFNALLRFIDENAKAITKEEENPVTGKKENTRITGPFTGDTAVNSIRDQLKAMMTSTINQITTALNKDGNTGYKGTEYSSASRIGIVTNREGYLDVDRDKLNKALTADFEGVRKLFSANHFSDTNGFKVGNFTKNSKAGVYEVTATGEVTLNGEKVEATVYGNIITTKDGLSFEVPSSNIKFDGEGNPYEAPAKVTFVRGLANQVSNFIEIAKSLTITLSNGKIVPGFFKQTENTYQERIKNIQERMDVLQRRVDNYSMRITNQFNSLERSMSTLQSQTSNMMSALSGLNYNTRR